MRILIVGQYFPPEPVPLLGDLARGLRELGHDMTVLTGFPNYPYGRIYDGYRLRIYQREVQDGIHLVRVPIFPDHSYSKLKRSLNYASFAISATTLGPFLTGRFDRILVFQTSPVTMGIPAVVLRWLRGGRLLWWVQDLWPDTLEASEIGLGPQLMRALRWMVKTIYHHCDLVLVESPGFVPRILELGVRPDRVVYLPNWAEDTYGNSAYDHEFATAEGIQAGFNVIFAGTVGVAQNLEVVLRTAALLRGDPDVRFVIIGDGAMYGAMVDLARQLNLQNVVFKGRRPASQMPKFFATAGALLVHLRRAPLFAINVPSKLQSYLASGRPVLAALEGVGAQIVQDAHGGIVCDPDDPQALRDAVRRLRDMPKRDREVMGMNARQYYEANFARGLILSRLNELLGAGPKV
jgi:glycosyltransferase involved in cell wall biosynthesis